MALVFRSSVRSFLAATSGIFRPFVCARRCYLQAHAPLFNQAPPSTPSVEAPESVVADLESQTIIAPGGGVVESKLPSGHIPGRFAIVYTCEVCQLRSAKTFSKHSYMKGVVLIRCDGCDKLHLIADNLGWFDHGKNIEEIFSAMGRKLSKLDAESAKKLVDIEPQIKAFVAETQAAESQQPSLIAGEPQTDAPNVASESAAKPL